MGKIGKRVTQLEPGIKVLLVRYNGYTVIGTIEEVGDYQIKLDNGRWYRNAIHDIYHTVEDKHEKAPAV